MQIIALFMAAIFDLRVMTISEVKYNIRNGIPIPKLVSDDLLFINMAQNIKK